MKNSGEYVEEDNKKIKSEQVSVKTEPFIKAEPIKTEECAEKDDTNTKIKLELGGQPQISNTRSRSSSNNTNTKKLTKAQPGKRLPGKLALCTRCGTQSENLSTCGRCKRKLPEDVKLLDDPAFKTQESDIKVEKSLKLKMLIRTRQYQIVSECVDEQWSPVDLGKKWGCSADNIRQWVNEAGKVLPKTYKKTEYNSESRTSTPGTMKTGNNASLPTTPLPPGLLGVAIGQLETYKKTERGRD